MRGRLVFFWLCIMGWFNIGAATPMQRAFAKYPNRYFIEIGTNQGAAVEAALSAGFPEIHSIDFSSYWYAHNRSRFRCSPNVHLCCGRSDKLLEVIIAHIHEPITFWFDASYSENKVTDNSRRPILQELDLIAQHAVKAHTILVGGLVGRCGDNFEYVHVPQVIKIIEAMKRVNPNYRIIFEDGSCKDAVLVAYIPRN